jgi:hypothetical protein
MWPTTNIQNGGKIQIRFSSLKLNNVAKYKVLKGLSNTIC